MSTLPSPEQLAEQAPQQPPGNHGDAGAGAPPRPHARGEASESDGGGEVVNHPTAELQPVAERENLTPRQLASVWLQEAKVTGTAAVDGSVFRSRPPSLRDMHARIVRADWAGGVPALRIAGQIDGWIGLISNTILYALAWVVRRPARRWVFTLVVTLTVVVPLLTT